MSVLGLVILLCLLGGLLWLITTKVPNLNPTIRWLITAVVIITAIILVLSATGLWDEIRGVKVPKI